MSDFQIGDEVICITNSGAENQLEVSKRYIVVDMTVSKVELKGKNGLWFKYRFKKILNRNLPEWF